MTADPSEVLRAIADAAREVARDFDEDGLVVCQRGDWKERRKKLKKLVKEYFGAEPESDDFEAKREADLAEERNRTPGLRK